MIIAVPKESRPGDNRVALVPESCTRLIKAGHTLVVQAGAGARSGYADAEYQAAGATLAPDYRAAVADADIVAKIGVPRHAAELGQHEIELLKEGALLIGFLDPLIDFELVNQLAARRLIGVSMELVPRLSRAQSMDALSSMANIAGYKAVLLAAAALPRMFPMMMTAAGTVSPAKVLVIGAGVAGLQAIATAKRLGAVVSGYDVRPAVKEQIESLGAKFVVLDVPTAAAEDKGGYAKDLGEEFVRKQREELGKVVKEQDVIITTAAIPGKKAPLLLTAEMVQAMRPGSVLVDLAAERGGNCELTQPDQTVTAGPVTILGPTNLASSVPYHASQLYARNVVTLLNHLTKGGQLKLDMTDEITAGCIVTRDGEIIHPQVRQLMGLPPRSAPAEAAPSPTEGSTT